MGLDRYDGELHCFGLRVMNHLIFPHILEMSGRRGPKEGVAGGTISIQPSVKPQNVL